MDKNKKQTVAVYCGSSSRLSELYLESARAVGSLLARAGAEIATGGGNMGMMKAVADGALAEGGTMHGIIPHFMVERGWHDTRIDLIEVEGMHRRKALMAEMSWGAIALPGGIGTFDELCEIMTWRQLGLFTGNVVIANFNNYFGPFLSMLETAVQQGFMNPEHVDIYKVAMSPSEAVEMALAPHSGIVFHPKF